FQIKAALKSSGSKPCTNAPMKCNLCKETHWKYNMCQHLRDWHPTWEVTMPSPSQETLSSAISISHDEECRLGVPEAARTRHQNSNSQAPTT
ncbi:hypothetical protein DFH07DRAFT_724722, partial [Mycena maculata]